jgi:hypothetical protein
MDDALTLYATRDSSGCFAERLTLNIEYQSVSIYQATTTVVLLLKSSLNVATELMTLLSETVA